MENKEAFFMCQLRVLVVELNLYYLRLLDILATQKSAFYALDKSIESRNVQSHLMIRCLSNKKEIQ